MLESQKKRKRSSEPTKFAKDAEIVRVIRKNHAPQVLKLAQQLVDSAGELLKIEEKMDIEAKELTGYDDYTTDHTVSFQHHGCIEDQMENLGEILGPGFKDVVMMANLLRVDAEDAASSVEMSVLDDNDDDGDSDE